jgi:copper amine oxidase-like protein
VKTLLTALALGIALLVPSVSALAADRDVKLTLDGRPVDRAGGVALSRGGVVYADVVPLVKSFNGLLTFQGDAVVVSIGNTVGRFTIGSRTAKIDQGSVTMRGQVFKRNGDIYVPLDTFVTRLAKAKLQVNAAQTQADISVNANPS